jgi:hypothetical protein
MNKLRWNEQRLSVGPVLNVLVGRGLNPLAEKLIEASAERFGDVPKGIFSILPLTKEQLQDVHIGVKLGHWNGLFHEKTMAHVVKELVRSKKLDVDSLPFKETGSLVVGNPGLEDGASLFYTLRNVLDSLNEENVYQLFSLFCSPVDPIIRNDDRKECCKDECPPLPVPSDVSLSFDSFPFRLSTEKLVKITLSSQNSCSNNCFHHCFLILSWHSLDATLQKACD